MVLCSPCIFKNSQIILFSQELCKYINTVRNVITIMNINTAINKYFHLFLFLIFITSGVNKLIRLQYIANLWNNYTLLVPFNNIMQYLIVVVSIIEIIIAISLLSQPHRKFSAIIACIITSFLTLVYSVEWTIQGLPIECGCGLHFIPGISSGIFVILRNIIIIVLLSMLIMHSKKSVPNQSSSP